LSNSLRAGRSGVQIHIGEQFGLANEFFMATSRILLKATVPFGLLMWRNRRRGTRLNQPGAADGFRTPTLAVGVATAFGVLFPLVGLSLLLVLAIELAAGRLRRRAA